SDTHYIRAVLKVENLANALTFSREAREADGCKPVLDVFRREEFFPRRLCSHFSSDVRLSRDCCPCNKPSTLMSSSRSGQWIPSPRAIKRQLLRSFPDPCSKRGNHARG